MFSASEGTNLEFMSTLALPGVVCIQHTTPGMFADNTYITMAHEDISTIEGPPLNSDLAAVHDWLKTNKLSCNTTKTSYITYLLVFGKT